MDLESKNLSLTEELSSAPTKKPSANSLDWIPRLPFTHSLASHRQPITTIVFHPIFNLLVSGSEDASLKIWDWEMGEFERTVKGHTKGINGIDFDSKGAILGELFNFLRWMWEEGRKNRKRSKKLMESLVSCSSDLTIKLWDSNNDWKNVKTLYGHDHSISSVKFLKGDDFIISGSRDKTIRVWEVATGYVLRLAASDRLEQRSRADRILGFVSRHFLVIVNG